MDTKLKPCKYGLIGVAGMSLLGIGFNVYVGYFDPPWLVGIIPVFILGYIDGSLGSKVFGKPIGALMAAFFGGIISTFIGAVIVGLFAMIVFQFGHATPRWFVPLIIFACLAAGVYVFLKDFSKD